MLSRQNLPLLLGGVLLLTSLIGLLFNPGAVHGALDLPAWVAEAGVPAAHNLPPLTRALPTMAVKSPAPKVKPAARQRRNPVSTATSPAAVQENTFLVLPPTQTPEAQPPVVLTPGTQALETTQALREPDHIVIPAIGLDAPVVPSNYDFVSVDGEVFQQWQAPSYFAAGWQTTSAGLGAPGNTVLNGHHNIDGMVFARLVDLQVGDTIQVFSGADVYTYRVTDTMILPERDEPLSVRMENAAWLQPTEDERLTLVTCWPADSNTHRLIIIARP